VASRPTALPQTLVILLDISGGPEMGGITDCGISIPNTLLRVARFAWAMLSNRGRYAVWARRTAAAASFTLSREAWIDG
jgi:hypothetical protein